MIRAGIIGGAGYTAGELLRLLIHQPGVEIAFVHSNSQSGKLISDIHDDLLGETNLVFTDAVQPADVLFLCMGHGQSKEWLAENPQPGSVKIIDLSQDFRIKAAGNDFVYGLPELNKEAVRRTQYLANPGCFATAIQLGLLPLAKAGWLPSEVHIHAITGSTGAGQKPTDTAHFSWRNNNMSVYKPFEHQHLKEIRQSLVQLQPSFAGALNFIPMRGDFPRGIYASLYADVNISLDEARQWYAEYYQDAPFVVISEANPHLKQVVNTNKCMLHLEKHGSKLFIISMIDNLTKGASGQAVQNMNLMFDLPETAGLRTKAPAF